MERVAKPTAARKSWPRGSSIRDATSAPTTGWGSADSFGDNNPVTFGIRDHALVVPVARPSWPIEKWEPVALQSFVRASTAA
jgi:hypothetical protein